MVSTATVIAIIFIVGLVGVGIFQVALPHGTLAGAVPMQKTQQEINLCMNDCMRECVTDESKQNDCLEQCNKKCGGIV